MGRVGLNRECGSRHFSTDSTADKLERTNKVQATPEVTLSVLRLFQQKPL
jgi:hypothetical protein